MSFRFSQIFLKKNQTKAVCDLSLDGCFGCHYFPSCCSRFWPLTCPGWFSSTDVALHGGREAGERAERDAEHNEAVRDHGVVTRTVVFCSYLHFLFYFIFLNLFRGRGNVTETHVSSTRLRVGITEEEQQRLCARSLSRSRIVPFFCCCCSLFKCILLPVLVFAGSKINKCPFIHFFRQPDVLYSCCHCARKNARKVSCQCLVF